MNGVTVMNVTLMDCTLRDGANVVGKGFSAELTDMMLDSLTTSRVPIIEFGNAGGIGAYDVAGFTAAETDQTYINIAKKYMGRGSMLGMFLNAKRFMEKSVVEAKEGGLSFLRVGADAGDARISLPVVREIKKLGLNVFYSAMKAYLLTPDELVEEGKRLEDAGLDMITIMDSAGTMFPEDVAEYTAKLTKALSIPVGFHGHNNLGLSAANAIAAYNNGASILDCGLMGMARSAGNLATEACVAIMRRFGAMEDIDFYGMLNFIEQRLQPAMEKHGFHNPLPPRELILGLSGCHSSFVKVFERISKETGANLFKLIVEVSKEDRKAPSEDLIRSVAERIK